MVLSIEVEGFIPNWLSPDTYLSLNYDALTTIAWAFLGVQSNGSLVKASYPPTSLINYAHSKGKKVVVSLNPGYGSSVIDSILANNAVQTILINNIVNEVQVNGFDGVDIDLEGFPTINTISNQYNKALFTGFIIQLSNALKSVNPNYRLSINLPPTDWANVFDTATLHQYVNYLMLMGYDYHWAKGPTAGAVAPLTSPNNQSVTNSVNNYLQTIPKSKLLLGVPYYGYEWSTQTNAPESSVIGTGASITYSQALTKIASYGRQWDSTWKSPYYTYRVGGQWHQGWYDDTESLGLKYDLVKSTGLAGIGIWAFGYDTPHPELANLIMSKFNVTTPTYQCVNNVCTLSLCTPGIAGCFTENTCGGTCSVSQYHNICQNNICTRISGTGTDECQTIGIACLPSTITYDCISNQCVQVQGTTGQYPDLSSCQIACVTPAPTECAQNELSLLGFCIPKDTYIYLTAGMILLLMVR